MANSIKTSKFYSYFLVIIQFVLIFLLGINSTFSNLNILNFSLINFGIILGLWSIWVTRKAKITVLPDVRKGSRLIKNGPYKFIRHPMYASVLIFCLGLLFTNYNIIAFVIYLLLFFDLMFKINFEEEKLINYFKDYKDYILKTKKLIPKVY